MKTAIATDSNSGIFAQEARALGVHVIPMPVIIEGTTYYEGVDLTPQTLYQAQLAHKDVSSSQPAPADVSGLFESLLASGYDEVVYIPMSSGLSGSYQTARMLAEDFSGRVQVVNNHRISVTQRQSVEDALRLRERGCSAAEIRETLERTGLDSTIFVGVETLEYLKRGGRVTPAGAALGTLLQIKPLLIIKGERLDAFAKVRGSKACHKRLVQEMRKCADEMKAAGIPIVVGVADSLTDEAEREEWKALVLEAFAGEEIHYDPLTCSIGCHVGPGAFGMGVSRKVV